MAIEFKDDAFEVAVSGETATITYTDKDAYINGIEGVSKEHTKKVWKYSNEYITAVTDKSVEKSIEVLKKNKDVKQVLVDTHMVQLEVVLLE